MIEPLSIEQYFENIATKNKVINHSSSECHFISYGYDEIMGELRSKVNSPFLGIEIPEGNYYDALSDNVRAYQHIAFTVYYHVKEGDKESEKQAIDDSQEVGRQILTWLRKDRMNGTIEELDLSEVSYNKVGPIFEGFFGIRHNIKIGEGKDLSFNADHWNA